MPITASLRSLLCAAACAWGLGLSAAHAADDTLRVATDVPYAPFQMQNPDGSFTGFEVELVDAICTRMHKRCEWVAQGWDGIIPGLLARKYDFIASSMSVTQERARQVLFAEPYFKVPSAWVVPDGEALDVDGDLAGRTIGVQRNTVQDNYVTATYPAAEVRRYADADGLANDMRNGRLDATFITAALAKDVLIDKGGFHQVGATIGEPESIFGPGIAAAFRPRDKTLVEAFNRALAEVRADGTYERLMHAYFDYDISP